MSDQPPPAGPEPMPTHPEEIKSVFDLRVGKFISLQGSARVTPAGIVTAGITASAILLACSVLVRAMRQTRSRT